MASVKELLPPAGEKLSKEEEPKAEQSFLFNVTQTSKIKPQNRF